jgi:hypothetical protein
MIWYNTCPRCNGNLVLESDLHGEFMSCMQCGGTLNEQQERALGLTGKPSPYAHLMAELMPSPRRLPVAKQKGRAA